MGDAPPPPKPAVSPSRGSEVRKKKVKTQAPSETEGWGQKRWLWIPDDEIAVLSGLAEYRSKKGRLPFSHEMDQLQDLMRGSLLIRPFRRSKGELPSTSQRSNVARERSF